MMPRKLETYLFAKLIDITLFNYFNNKKKNNKHFISYETNILYFSAGGQSKTIRWDST